MTFKSVEKYQNSVRSLLPPAAMINAEFVYQTNPTFIAFVKQNIPVFPVFSTIFRSYSANQIGQELFYSQIVQMF